jgi:hypothetical protein
MAVQELRKSKRLPCVLLSCHVRFQRRLDINRCLFQPPLPDKSVEEGALVQRKPTEAEGGRRSFYACREQFSSIWMFRPKTKSQMTSTGRAVRIKEIERL